MSNSSKTSLKTIKPLYANIIGKLHFASVLVFVFWLPLFEGFMPTIFGVWIGFWLLEGNFKQRFKAFNPKQPLFLGLLAYFVLSIVAMLYTQNTQKGWLDVQQKIAFVVFPILLGGMPQFFWKHIRWVFIAFIAGLFMASTFDLIHAYFASIDAGASENVFRYWVYDGHRGIGFFKLISMRYSYFSYGYFSYFMHPSYFSMYLVFSIPLIYYLYNNSKHKNNGFIGFFFLLLGLYFVFVVYLLQSTAGLISLVVVLLMMLYKEKRFSLNKKVSYYISGFFFFILSAIFIVFLTWQSQNETFSLNAIHDSLDLSTSSSIRIEIWKNTFSIGIESPLWGIGPGDIRDNVKDVLFISGDKRFATGNFNMHNQFLESFIGLGIIGLSCLLLILARSLRVAFRNKEPFLLYLIVILLINFFFESVLNRQSGLFFTLFFLSFFVFTPQNSRMRNRVFSETINSTTNFL